MADAADGALGRGGGGIGGLSDGPPTKLMANAIQRSTLGEQSLTLTPGFDPCLIGVSSIAG